MAHPKNGSALTRHIRGLTVGEALTRARATGKVGRVTSATTASSTLTANPDGSLTLRESSAPVRKWTGSRWRPLDPTLVRSGHLVVTRMTTSDLALSGGGTGPLVTMRLGAHSLSLWLPMRLPAPVLSGASATYRSVLPGVDLEVAADAQGGFSEIWVVHDAAAGRNPRLRHLMMRAGATRVRLGAGAGGSILARDAAGVPVFTAERPSMWDSSRPSAREALVRDPATGMLVDERSGMPAFSSPTGPGVAARSAWVRLRVTRNVIRLAPSDSMLSSRSTVFPVYIDPTFTAPSAGSTDSGAWAQVDSTWPGQTYWKGSGLLQVGDQDWSSPTFVARSFVRMPIPSAIQGAVVLSAQLNFTEEYAPSCTAANVDLWQTGGISSSTTWSNQPSWNTELGEQDVAHGYDSSCPAHGVGFDITSYIQGLANKSTVPSNETFGLRANDESNPYGWKQFSRSATMSITYDHTADTPKSADLTTNPPTACTASTPTTIGDGNVTLNVLVDDPDKGSNGSPQVGAQIKLWDTKTGTEVSGFPTSPGSIYADWGQTASIDVSKSSLEALAGGSVTEFSWQAEETDFRKNSSGDYVYSGWSTTCHFNFDPTRQAAPDVTESGSATISQPATFSVTYDGGGTVPSSYQYQLNGGPPATASASSGSASIEVTPYRKDNSLYVTSVSPGGNIGGTQALGFTAAPAATAPDGDLTGDGKPDLLTVGGVHGLPAGLWLAPARAAGRWARRWTSERTGTG